MELNAHRALGAGVDVIVDACALDPRTRMMWRHMASELGAQARLVVFTTPLHVCQARDAARRLEQRAKVDWVELSRKLERSLERVALEGWDQVTCLSYVWETEALR
jgi:predicted kinase